MINYIILFILIFGASIPAYGEYYKYEDSNGNVIITDNPSNVPESQKSKTKTIKQPQADQITTSESEGKRNKYDEELNKQLQDKFVNESNAKKNCAKQTRDQAEQAIKTTWKRMAELMVSGDYEKAYDFFSNKDEMKRKMAGLTREDIKMIFGSYKSIKVESLYQDDVIEDAQCGIIREEKSGIYSYSASFVRGPFNCEWRIRDF